jgi:hypothetical protein
MIENIFISLVYASRAAKVIIEREEQNKKSIYRRNRLRYSKKTKLF